MAYGNSTADNWTGGSRSGGAPASTPIGGTVSGLSGTVVLQDNGGDDLSVTPNGPFTFATPLADGAAYNVTVQDQPVRPDLHGLQRLGHGGRGQRHQCRGVLRERQLSDTRCPIISTGPMAGWGRTGRPSPMAGCRSPRRW